MTSNTPITAAWKQVPLAVGTWRLQARNLPYWSALELIETNAANSAPADALQGWTVLPQGEEYRASAGRHLWARCLGEAGAGSVLSITPAA